jgi:hypothetical protein
MAGGMNKRGSTGMPMSQRVAAAVPDSLDPLPLPAGQGCPARHCWVLDPVDGSHARRPGLLVEWRRTAGGGWDGRVVYAAALRAGEWALVEEWVPAVLVRPA